MTGIFQTADWVKSTTVYEVNLRQYDQDAGFLKFINEIPRLRDMGVEVLWFMPIHPIGEKNRKGSLGSYYSVKDYRATNPEYGSIDDFKRLVDAAHQQGMKVIIDWVANHAAWDNVWTKDHPDFFERDSAGNFISPYDWSDVIQINHKNPAEQDSMIAAMKFWVQDCNIDGFRCDLAHLTPLDFWKRARRELDPLKKDMFWLAETEEISFHEAFDASYTWEWMHKTEDFYKKKCDRAGLDSVLQRYKDSFPATACRLYFTSNHDENTWNGTELEKYGDMYKALAVFNCTWNGIPLVYTGQEIPVTRRIKFFDKDPITWPAKQEYFDFYRTLLTLHRRHPALRAADPAVTTYRLSTTAPGKIMAFLRRNGNREVLVVLNLSPENKTRFDISDPQLGGKFKNVFSAAENDFSTEKSFEMQGWEYLVYEK